MPIFVTGFLLSEGVIGWQFWLGLFVFHVLFYGGSVAYNSYYDQDDGPIGGLYNPPKAGRDVLYFSIAIQVIGLCLMALVNIPVLLVSLVMVAMSTAYSHPMVRFKKSPMASLLTVSFGQGAGAFIAGWLCGNGDWLSLLSLKALLGVLLMMAVTTGFYPLTQLFQIDEDTARGDMTFAVKYERRSFLFAVLCWAIALICGIALAYLFYGVFEIICAAGCLVSLICYALWWRAGFNRADVRSNYLKIMRIGYIMPAGFAIFLIAEKFLKAYSLH